MKTSESKINQFVGIAQILKDGQLYVDEVVNIETTEASPKGKFNRIKGELIGKHKTQFPDSKFDVVFGSFNKAN